MPHGPLTAVAILLTKLSPDAMSADDWTEIRHLQPHQALALQRSLAWEI